MTSTKRVFVVTGANKGIGKSIVKLLLQDKEDEIVYLTARNEERGQKTVHEFEQNGLKPRFHQLDIIDQDSIDNIQLMKSWILSIKIVLINSGII